MSARSCRACSLPNPNRTASCCPSCIKIGQAWNRDNATTLPEGVLAGSLRWADWNWNMVGGDPLLDEL